jgi:ATP-dependent protease ClpP protease subunit
MGEPTKAQVPAVIESVYTIFCGQIDQIASQRIVNSLTAALSGNIRHIHVLFQSAGGFVGDGVFLYNLFRAVPIEVTLYNGGQISSAAVVAYLGARHRKTSARATFMMHRATNNPQSAGAAKLQSIAKSLAIETAGASNSLANSAGWVLGVT